MVYLQDGGACGEEHTPGMVAPPGGAGSGRQPAELGRLAIVDTGNDPAVSVAGDSVQLPPIDPSHDNNCHAAASTAGTCAFPFVRAMISMSSTSSHNFVIFTYKSIGFSLHNC